MSILKKYFYNRPTKTVALDLLGKILCRKMGNEIIKGKIVEVEAYLGAKDLACHTSKGKTQRNKIMFGPAGRAYVYFVYGMHYCFNVVTEKEGSSCAVLIRALEPIICPLDKGGRGVLNGPAKLCREFQIDKSLNGHDLTLGKKLWVEGDEKIKPGQIKKSARVGVDYAGIWKDKLLRFYIKDSKFISRK